MAKKSVVNRNNKRVLMSKNNALLLKRNALKIKILQSTNFSEKIFYSSKLAQLPRDSSRVRVRNRCSITGRGRGFYRCVLMSRCAFRLAVSNGDLPGFVKASS